MKSLGSTILVCLLFAIIAPGCGDNAVPTVQTEQPINNPGVLPPSAGDGVEPMLPPPPGATTNAMSSTTGAGANSTAPTEQSAEMAPVTFGPCDENTDCSVGYCIASPDGDRVCSEYCATDTDCPDLYECRAIRNTRPDTVFICVAERQVQCLSCTRDSDCGIGEDRCIMIGRTQRCAAGCLDEPCGEGYSCQDSDTPEGRADLCIPDIGSCDPCVDPDGDRYGTGECIALDCVEGNPDINPGATELCDNVDNDCDGSTDEGFDLASDTSNCGLCGNVCSFPHATPTCVEGVCAIEGCLDNFYDTDGEINNGCEYGCIPSTDPTEICDGIDNDCDGNIDEDAGLGVDLPDVAGVDTNCDGIDGDINRSVFVSPLGLDSDSGTTPDTPVQTLQRAIEVSFAAGRDQILMTRGDYALGAPLRLVPGKSFYGGYSPTFNRRAGRSVMDFGSRIGIEAHALAGPVLIQSVEVKVADAQANGNGHGETIVAVDVKDCSNFLTLEDVHILAGQGGDGSDGAPGGSGLPGEDGDAANDDKKGVGGGENAGNRGGSGGDGYSTEAGEAGQAGLLNGAECGSGGQAGRNTDADGNCCVDGRPPITAGGNGPAGCLGVEGIHGSPGVGPGGWSHDGRRWAPPLGNRGSDGTAGGGGGGGGSSGGANCWNLADSSGRQCEPDSAATFLLCLGGLAFGTNDRIPLCGYLSIGLGGGGGGSGGSGGQGGQPGHAGGGSIAVLVANSIVNSVSSTFETRGGGTAGRGGDGGLGGEGGNGGLGGRGVGGNGGIGGRGGSGGCGAGGMGGPSIGMWMTRGGQANMDADSRFILGPGGAGGGLCDAGEAAYTGRPGAVVEIHTDGT